MGTYRAGDTIEDLCRACKLDRLHSVIAADGSGQPARVQCGYCGSQHNYRGGGRTLPRPSTPSAEAARTLPPRTLSSLPPVVPEREITPTSPSMTTPAPDDLERLLRRVIREETGLTPAVPAAKWRGGTLALKPGNAALSERTWPIDTLFHKIVMIRNRLRTLEQQINGMDLPEVEKVRLQGYITGCYGSLTSFNVLFADEADQFRGSSGDDH